MADSARRYYEKNRDSIMEQMRARDTERREQRRKYLEEHPEERDLEREKMRGKYHNWTANKCKRQMEAWIADETVPDAAKSLFRHLLTDDKYKSLKPKALRLMCDPLNITASVLDD